jgi:hypothetical protein
MTATIDLPPADWAPPMFPPTIDELLSLVMDEITSVGKSEVNRQQGFQYRGIDAVLNEVGPAFRKHRVKAIPTVLDKQYADILVGKDRTPMTRVTVTVEYAFRGPTGNSVTATVIGEAFDSGDKATAKAMSVAYRIALIQVLALPTNEPDPDAFTYERAQAEQQQPQQQGRQGRQQRGGGDWVVTMRNRINRAGSLPALYQIAGQITEHAKAGNLGDADGNSLQTAYDARLRHLQHEQPPAQPRPPRPGASDSGPVDQRPGQDREPGDDRAPAGPDLIHDLTSIINRARTKAELNEAALAIGEEQQRGNLDDNQALHLKQLLTTRQDNLPKPQPQTARGGRRGGQA